MRKVILAVVLAAAIPLFAQRSKFEVNTETPEGKMLAEIGAESDPAKKIALADKFLAEHPTHEGAPWLSAQMQPIYIQAGQFDKAMTAAEKVVAVEPDALEISYQGLKAAEGKKDAKGVVLWSGKTSDIAKKIAASPQPAERCRRGLEEARRLRQTGGHLHRVLVVRVGTSVDLEPGYGGAGGCPYPAQSQGPVHPTGHDQVHCSGPGFRAGQTSRRSGQAGGPRPE